MRINLVRTRIVTVTLPSTATFERSITALTAPTNSTQAHVTASST